jgi:hypothetical protein
MCEDILASSEVGAELALEVEAEVPEAQVGPQMHSLEQVALDKVLEAPAGVVDGELAATCSAGAWREATASSGTLSRSPSWSAEPGNFWAAPP